MKGQPWIRPVIKKPPLDVRPSLGRWRDRLEALDIDFTGGYREQFNQLLAITWGVRESKLVGKASTQWEVVEKTTPAHGAGRIPLPDPEQLWELDSVPHLIRGLVKAQSLRDGTYIKWIRQDRREWLEGQRRRMSHTMFRLYILGQNVL